MKESQHDETLDFQSTSDDSFNYAPSKVGLSLDLEDDKGSEQMLRRINSIKNQDATMDRVNALARTLSAKSYAKSDLQINPDDFDLIRTLRALSQRFNDQGFPEAYTGITFKGLTSTGIDIGAKYWPTVSDFYYGLIEIPKKLFNKTPERDIIHDVYGIVKPGELLLVLGRPGAGCTTLLKTIASETDQFTGVSGELLYDGASSKQMNEYFRKEIIYNPELDVHFPHLTVQQTLDFAISLRTPETRLDNQTRKEYKNFVLQLLTTVFGLRHTLDTKVGNDYVRGVSGGERKRVSIAEALAAQASIYCWDNATRGLDASTALEYTQAIRASANFLRNIGIVAIYQASENIFDLFDKVTVLYEGRQIYFGTTKDAKAFFENMGFHCPPRQASAEFLTAITDPKGRIIRPGFENKVPRTAEEFEAYWHNSAEFHRLLIDIDEYNVAQSPESTIERFIALSKFQKMKRQSDKSRFTVGYMTQLKHVTMRGYKRLMGDKSYTITNVIGTIAQALIIGSLYYNISHNTSGAFSRAGVLFFALMFNSLSSMAEIPTYFDDRLIVMKQKGYSLYRPSTESIQYILSNFPFKIATYVIFGVVVYFLSQLQQQAGKFFFYLLLLVFVSFSIAIFFQMLTSWTHDAGSALAFAGVALIVIFVYSGYIIPMKNMHPWFKWLSYLNPLQYGFESLISNEFHGVEMPCDLFVPSGPGYENISSANQVCAFSGSVLGVPTVLGDAYISAEYGYHWSHAWRNLGIVIGFLIAFVILSAIGVEVLRPVAGGGDVLLFKRGHKFEPQSKEEHFDVNNNITRQVTSLRGADPDIFSWQNVNYTVPVNDGERQLLKNVQGYVKPGTLTALMGESGAGKTTLLNVLSQRVNVGVISGDIFVNGSITDSSFKRSTGYVQQQDLHLAEATVREALRFSARLRQPGSVPDNEKLEWVEKIIDLLGMRSYAEAFVGKVGEGLNVEQRKKLSIGVELAAKPSLLLFLDEPTSGLDSQSAWGVVLLMKQLAAAGQSILCTIHQPSATLFEQFDRLLLLKKGGETVYFGDIGENSNTLIKYFENHGSRECGPSENPAEYILECIGAGATASVEENWGEIWLNSTEGQEVTHEVTMLNEELRQRPKRNVTPQINTKFAVSHWTQFKYVLIRTSLQFWRSPVYIFSLFIMLVLGGLFVGFTFWNLKNTLSDLRSALFGVFLVIIVTQPISNSIAVFAEQSRNLYEVREAASNTFHWAHLLMSQFLAQMPYSILFSTLLFFSFYFPVKYDTSAPVAGFFFFVYCILFQFFYVSFSLAVLYFSPNAPAAAIINALLFSFMIAFCGVTQPYDMMPKFWTFMYKVSPHTYFVQSLLGVIVENRKVICEGEEFNYFQPPSNSTCQEFAGQFVQNVGGYLQNPDATSNCAYCRYTVGAEYLATINIHSSQKWRNVGFFFVYIVFNVVAMLGLYYLFRVKVWKFPKLSLFGKKKSEEKQPEKA